MRVEHTENDSTISGRGSALEHIPRIDPRSILAADEGAEVVQVYPDIIDRHIRTSSTFSMPKSGHGDSLDEVKGVTP